MVHVINPFIWFFRSSAIIGFLCRSCADAIAAKRLAKMEEEEAVMRAIR